MSTEAVVLACDDLPGDDLPSGDLPGAGAPAAGRQRPIDVRLNSNGILEIQLPPNREIDGDEARTAGATALTLAGGRRLPVLLVIRGVPSLSGEARQILTGSVTAVASAFAVVGESPVDRVIAHYVLRPKTGMVPARFFTAWSEAAEWLGQCANDD